MNILGLYEKLSMCGLYCGGCKNFKEHLNCQGCRNEKELVDDCPTRECCINKGYLHCGECIDFPCSVLNDFYNDGIRHHELAFENILKIKKIGLDNWLLEQEEEHTCLCGKRKFWFSSKCSNESCFQN